MKNQEICRQEHVRDFAISQVASQCTHIGSSNTNIRAVGARVLICLSSAWVLAGCADIPVHQPNQSSVSQISVVQARKTLQTCLETMNREPYRAQPLQEIKVRPDGFEFFEQGMNAQLFGPDIPYSKQYSFRFRDLALVSVVKKPDVTGGPYWALPGGEWAGGNFGWRDLRDASSFADALNRLIIEARGGDQLSDAGAFEEFKEKAKAWRALAVKPDLPEQARRQRVLAENAVSEKRFEEAVEYYEKGLAIAPLWPEGHFNAAILSGEVESYSSAIQHMQCYLELAPEASDAQSARDKIYIWEEKLKLARGKTERSGNLQFTSGSCCDKAQRAGTSCGHKCCVAARYAGEICEKCNRSFVK